VAFYLYSGNRRVNPVATDQGASRGMDAEAG